LYIKGELATKCRQMLDAVPKITERRALPIFDKSNRPLMQQRG